jgi:hypothetical protein
MSVLRHLGQDQSEIEVAALLAADSNEKLHYQRGRISALLWFADLPQRVATAMKESYQRDDRDAARTAEPADYSAHWGSPNFASEWGRRPAVRHTSPIGSGTASDEPGGTLTG